MKKHSVQIFPYGSKYEIYINGNYIGTFSKTIANLKLRLWNLPEIEF